MMQHRIPKKVIVLKENGKPDCCFNKLKGNVHRAIVAAVIVMISISATAQSSQDIIIKDSVLPFLNYKMEDVKLYQQVKKTLRSLEPVYGYEVNLQKRLLSASYQHNDTLYFKEQMARLVEDHGFNVSFMSGDENYYEAIIHGELSKWFKPMYINKHAKWLENNFDKQVEIRKLNEIHDKDQLVTRFAMRVLDLSTLDSIQKEQIKTVLADYHFHNISPLIDVVQNRGIYPNDKSLGVLQSSYDTALIHNFQFKENMERMWPILFPAIKKAYINHEITNVIFENYDFYAYLHYGYQEFNSFTIDEIPEQFKKDSQKIPLKDPEAYKKIKTEFNWE